jgi:predicted anti-sigma-YlaC factor YlaD
MKIQSHRCNTQQLLRYQDGDLTIEEQAPVAEHLTQCAECRRFLKQQQQIRVAVQRSAESVAAQIPRPDVEARLIARIRNQGNPEPAARTLWRPRRWIPVGALVMTLLAGVVFIGPWQETGGISEPSAIVESFHGNVSTVMILETQNTGQTIVWFNEIDEPNGESDGNQNTPSAVDRSAHPAAHGQWGLGRA